MRGPCRFGRWAVVLLLFPSGGVGHSDETATNAPHVSSQSYPGHDNDADSSCLVRAYPDLVGTRLDDCQTCHTGGVVERRARREELNPCSYCHLIPYPDEDVSSGAPASYEESLNPFGLAYKTAGRDDLALRRLAGLDSDEDGYTNAVELDALRYPGDPSSMPGQPVIPQVRLTRQDMQGLPRHQEFLLLNSHQQRFDAYATYAGVKIVDILNAAGANLAGATSVTLIAPDGYMKDFGLDEISHPFPAGLYHAGLDPGGFVNRDQGFVMYPPADQVPSGLVDGGQIPGEQWMIIASERDGARLETGNLDPVTGRLEGEGPFRLIVPQASPGRPDRGSRFSSSGFGDGHDFDSNLDHNAGLCVRAVVAVRVNPLPSGYEEFDWKNGGFSLLENARLLVYGHGITGE